MIDLALGGRESYSELCFPWETPPAPGQVQEVADGILWLRMPLPFGLDHINLYLLKHEHGWVVVDTGLGTDQSKDVWERVFEEALHGEPVLAVICTHFHYDHTGMLGWLVDRFQCPAYMSFGEYQAMFVTPPKGDKPNWAFDQFFQRCGLSSEEIAGFRPVLTQTFYSIEAPSSFRRLSEGSELRIGNRNWRVVMGSGHSPEHACLYNDEDQLLISGDQILPRITSSVCVGVTEPEANPLGDWLESVRRFRSLPDSVLVLPAHERPFHGLHHRLQQLQKHHDDHFDRITAALAQPMTTSALRPVLFPRIKNSFDLLMAVGETQAHLNFLLNRGLLVRELRGDAYHYSLAGAADQGQFFAEDIHV
ncbi:MBL fold metallo-hydrolase [Pseudomonas saliphila]|uniref:MBL fold metallo-hydrolase n=1 Tax=Pseudomonas saliphila TaxID=2586906 RepID=UPI0012391133|nr:MBL fold metallo-hydrolase [Pseudomonas saliphila]